VRITRKGITHAFEAKKNGKHSYNQKITARATLEITEILKGSIETNRLHPRGEPGVLFSRVMMGTVGMEDANGNTEYYAVRMVIQERTDHESVLTDLDILGNLYAAKAKKVGPQGLQGITKVKSPSGTAAAYTYNIAHFLDDVKGVFKNTFSNDVYQTLGVQREQDDFANDLLYSISEENSSDKLYSIDDSADVSENAADTIVGGTEETPFEKALRRSGLAHLIDGGAEAESGRRQPGDRGTESQAQEH
jgi:hypothetical protein